MRHILQVNKFNVGMLKGMLEGISDEQMAHQPAGLPNHPAWQLGHLAFVRLTILNILGKPLANAPGEEWDALFRPGSTPVGDRTKYPSKAELMATFDRAQAALAEAVAALTPAQVEGPHPVERLRERFATLGALVATLMTSHDALHLGQLSDWRRVMGLPRVM